MQTAKKKQMVLKALLLVALAGNISGHSKLTSLDFASKETVSSGGGVSAQKQSSQPVSVPNPPANAVTTSDQGPQPDAPAKVTYTEAEEPVATLAVEKPSRSEAPSICGQRFFVTYTEKSTPNGMTTELTIKPHAGPIQGFKSSKFRLEGGFEINLDNEDVKADNDKKLAQVVRSKLGGRCREAVEPIVRPELPAKDLAEEKKRIKEGMKECRLDSKGEPLSEVERARCQLRALDSIDPDDEGKRGSAKAMRAVEKLVKGGLRTSIKNRLMSEDESKVEEGESMLDEAIDRIESLGLEHDLDSRKTTRMIMELKALKTGGQAFRETKEFAKEVKEIKSELQEEMKAAQAEVRTNPNDMYARERLLQIQREVVRQQSLLNNKMLLEINNGAYGELQAAQRMGFLNSAEFNQFKQPYLQAQGDISNLMGGSGFNISNWNSTAGLNNGVNNGINNPGLPQMPNDFNQYRTNLAQGFNRNAGVQPMQRPTNLGNFGLTNNGLATSFQQNNPPLFTNMYSPPNRVAPLSTPMNAQPGFRMF